MACILSYKVWLSTNDLGSSPPDILYLEVVFATPNIFVLESSKEKYFGDKVYPEESFCVAKDHVTHHIRRRTFATPNIFVLEPQKKSILEIKYTRRSLFVSPKIMLHITSGGELLRPRIYSYSNPQKKSILEIKYTRRSLFVSPKIMLHITSGGELLRPRISSYSSPKRSYHIRRSLFVSPKIVLHITSGGEELLRPRRSSYSSPTSHPEENFCDPEYIRTRILKRKVFWR